MPVTDSDAESEKGTGTGTIEAEKKCQPSEVAEAAAAEGANVEATEVAEAAEGANVEATEVAEAAEGANVEATEVAEAAEVAQTSKPTMIPVGQSPDQPDALQGKPVAEPATESKESGMTTTGAESVEPPKVVHAEECHVQPQSSGEGRQSLETNTAATEQEQDKSSNSDEVLKEIHALNALADQSSRIVAKDTIATSQIQLIRTEHDGDGTTINNGLLSVHSKASVTASHDELEDALDREIDQRGGPLLALAPEEPVDDRFEEKTKQALAAEDTTPASPKAAAAAAAKAKPKATAKADSKTAKEKASAAKAAKAAAKALASSGSGMGRRGASKATKSKDS